MIVLAALAALLTATSASEHLTLEDAHKVALQSIAYYAPHVDITLDNSESQAFVALEKAGVVTRGELGETSPSLTEHGRILAARYGWLFYHGTISIAVGRFVLDRNKPVIVRQNGPWATLTYRVYFEENSNGMMLASLADSEAWPIRSFPDLALSLNDDGRVATETISVVCAARANCNLLEK